METINQTKRCNRCCRELQTSEFSKNVRNVGGFNNTCKACLNKAVKDRRAKTKIIEGKEPNPDLAGFTPQQLICELRARGYTGDLVFVEIKTHKIKI